MTEKSASVQWTGAGKKGVGKISIESGAMKDYPYGFASRFGDDRKGTNPEEILGAAGHPEWQSSPYITCSASSRSPNSPTNSSDEANFLSGV